VRTLLGTAVNWRPSALRLVTVALLLSLVAAGSARGAIVTWGSNSTRSGLYQGMRRLSPKLLRAGGFGRLFDTALPDRGKIFAQPLVANGRLIVVTENNFVYELDPRTGRILVSRQLAPPWPPRFPTPGGGAMTCPDLTPVVGATATPVIDTSAPGGGVIYLTAKTQVPGLPTSPTVAQGEYLVYALRLKDLSNVQSWGGGQPVPLNGFAADNAPGVTFNATYQLQRPGLLMMGGVVYMGFGSHCDFSPFRGWVVGVRASDGAVVARWVSETAAIARGGGTWGAGAGLMSDGPGRIFLSTGNGFNGGEVAGNEHTPATRIPGHSPPGGLASSVVGLQVQSNGSLAAADFFSPCDNSRLDGSLTKDVDVSSGGVVALPAQFGSRSHHAVLLAGGKSGSVYVLDRNNLGGHQEGGRTSACPAGGDAVVQTLSPQGGIYGAPAAWPGDGGWFVVPTSGKSGANEGSFGSLNFYTGRAGGFRLAGATGAIWAFGSSSPVITSVGLRNGSAIVWAVDKTASGSATLRAYSLPITRGAHAPAALAAFPVGTYAKFTAPGVGTDSIYVGTGVGHVLGFGPRTGTRSR